MKKKLIALAIAGAFVAPVAMADTSNVTISGTLDMSIDNVNGKTDNNGGAATDNGRQWGVSSNASNVVFSGNEDLGNGLSAIWQLQTFINFGGTGGNAANDGTLSNGVSYLGLKSKSWGSLMVGKLDSSMKLLGRKVDLFGNHLGDSRNIIQKDKTVGFADWDPRPTNTIMYSTPDFNGFTGIVHYTTNTAGTYTTDSSTTVWGVAGNYENGPIFVGAAYMKYNEDRGIFTGLENPSAWRLAGGYNFGDFKVVALWESTKDNSLLPGVDDNRNAWGLGGAYKFGMNTVKVQYYRAQDFGNVSDTSAGMWALGLDHAMSKRTTAYVGYAHMSNDNLVNYSMSGAGHDDNYGTITGKTNDGFQIGMVHKF
jgi:predicted porin